MRALITTEHFFGKSRYSRTSTRAKSTNEKSLVTKLVEYVVKWGKTEHPPTQQAKTKSEQKEEEEERSPKIIKISAATTYTHNGSRSDVSKTAFHSSSNLEMRSRFMPEARAQSMPAFSSPQEQLGNVIPLEVNQLLVRVRENGLPRDLLKYPVQPLQHTLTRYLESVQPLLSESEMQKEEDLAVDFMRNQGYELQSLLEKTGQSNVNWLTDRWTNVSYLGYRAPLTIFSSSCISFPQQNFLNSLNFLSFTAKAIYAMCEFHSIVENNQLPVRKLEGFDLDNSQFYNVFGTVRIPQRSSDTLQQCASNYVVVIHKNNFYKLPVFDAEDMRIFNVFHIRKQLFKIIKSGRPLGKPIGLLTHDRRDHWAEGHELLCRNQLNAQTIKCIEQSLFTVSLDEAIHVPAGEERVLLASQLMHGGGPHINSANRWMDKTLQLIVNPNGIAGLCCEHSPAEPQPAASIMDYVLKKIPEPTYGNDAKDSYQTDALEWLFFDEKDESISFWLKTANRTVNELTSRLQLHATRFECYGKKLLHTQHLESDCFIQMALQLAFYRLHRQLPAQMETAHLRIFKYGRSEIIRTTSNESLKFVFAMISEDETTQNRLLALKAAVDHHRQQTMLALKGCGIDRHFFGLEQMAYEHGIALPNFFQSDGFLKSKDFRILSSQLLTPHDSFMVYGPLNSDGYGCCYNLRDNDITFTISAWNHNPEISPSDFGMAIETALADMGHLILDLSNCTAVE
ncbi:carnitine O-acetyltransferase-like isoform X2 [Drosophila hydei]|uniref:Carnitine O-acetyltransferase-like isoform X2 n=1 Tax=Drosophila hydei TaxID=7224 RepID=A0A6J1L4X1_DROHY|nr:carnitine O-acetyltransferase-like isoform X2 [Drosophila hydei]